MFIKLFFLITLYCFGLTTGLTQPLVYQHQDQNGHVTFSDQSQGGVLIPIKEMDVSAPVASNPSVPTIPDIQSAHYERIEIIKPHHEETIRDNEGRVTIELVVSPALRPGDTLTLLLDGQPVKKLISTDPIELQGLERGTHTLSLVLTDPQGQIQQTSQTITIFVHKAYQRREYKRLYPHKQMGPGS